jgi:hypothetical protein
MAQWYDQQIIETVGAAERPLRHSEIAARIAPGNNRAWNQIGTSLTRLYRAGQLSRMKCDGHYWHYTPGTGAPCRSADLSHLVMALNDDVELLQDALNAAERRSAELEATLGQALAERDRARADAEMLHALTQNYMHCPICHGDGVHWSDVNGEAEAEPCDAWPALEAALKEGFSWWEPAS